MAGGCYFDGIGMGQKVIEWLEDPDRKAPARFSATNVKFLRKIINENGGMRQHLCSKFKKYHRKYCTKTSRRTTAARDSGAPNAFVLPVIYLEEETRYGGPHVFF